MFLDLLIRSSGVSGTPAQHLQSLVPKYDGATVILYGPDIAGLSDLPSGSQVVGDSDQLSLALQAAGNGQVVVYGADELLALARHLPVSTIWVALTGGNHDVREVWRIRQQHSWVSSKRLALLVEWLAPQEEPDQKHLMRLTRASETMLVSLENGAEENDGTLVDELAAAFPATVQEQAAQEQAQQVMAEAAPAEQLAVGEALSDDERSALFWDAPSVTQGSVAVAAEEPAGAEAAEIVQEDPEDEDPESGTAGVFEPLAAIVATQAAPVEPEMPMTTQDTPEGADLTVEENNSTTFVAEAPATGSAEQALLRRYALVKERRTTTARVTEVKENLDTLLKEVFVSRFTAGVEAAEAFEALTKKLADTSAEYTQLSKSLINIESELAKLEWLKDEIEL